MSRVCIGTLKLHSDITSHHFRTFKKLDGKIGPNCFKSSTALGFICRFFFPSL